MRVGVCVCVCFDSFSQVMSAGAIPVFVVRDWIKPFHEQIDWPSFSFVFSPDDVGPIMMETLRAVEPAQLLEMQVIFGIVCCLLFLFLLVLT